jgi:hypothetical protein
MYRVTWPCIDGSSCMTRHGDASMVGNVIYQIMPWILVIGALVHPYGPRRFHCPLLLWSVYYLTEQCCHSSVGDHTVQYTVIAICTVTWTANFIIKCTSIFKYSLKSNRENLMSWVVAMTYNEASHCPLDLSIYLLLTEWLSMNQYIPLMDLNSSTQKIYERYLGSVVVVISMNHVLSLNNNNDIILSSFTLLLYVSMKFCGTLDSNII